LVFFIILLEIVSYDKCCGGSIVRLNGLSCRVLLDGIVLWCLVRQKTKPVSYLLIMYQSSC